LDKNYFHLEPPITRRNLRLPQRNQIEIFVEANAKSTGEFLFFNEDFAFASINTSI